MTRLLSRDFALYLNGVGMSLLVTALFFINPTWPAWTGGVGMVAVLGVGLLLVKLP